MTTSIEMSYELLNKNTEYKNTFIELIANRTMAEIVRRNCFDTDSTTTQDIYNFINQNIESILKVVFDDNQPATVAIAKLYSSK